MAQEPGAPPGRGGGDQHGDQGEDQLEAASRGHRQQKDDDGQHGGGGWDGRDDDAQQQPCDCGSSRGPVAVLLRGGQVDLGLASGRGADGRAGLRLILTAVMILIVRGILPGGGRVGLPVLGGFGITRSITLNIHCMHCIRSILGGRGVVGVLGVLDVLGLRLGLCLLIQVGEVGDLLGGESVELGALLVGEQVGTHQSGQDEVPPVGAHCAGQRQQRPGQDEVDQEGAEAPLAQGEQEAGRQGPHECRPGPQHYLPGHRAGGEPCPQRRQGHGQEHQGTDERAGLQPHQPSQGRR